MSRRQVKEDSKSRPDSKTPNGNFVPSTQEKNINHVSKKKIWFKDKKANASEGIGAITLATMFVIILQLQHQN